MAASNAGGRVTVRRYRAAERWDALLDGEVVGGLFAYRDDAGRLVLDHTEVDVAFEGRGIGSALARTALGDVREGGERVVVRCPFVRSWVRRHPGFDDLIDDPFEA